jgi:hypothetical protein
VGRRWLWFSVHIDGAGCKEEEIKEADAEAVVNNSEDLGNNFLMISSS